MISEGGINRVYRWASLQLKVYEKAEWLITCPVVMSFLTRALVDAETTTKDIPCLLGAATEPAVKHSVV